VVWISPGKVPLVSLTEGMVHRFAEDIGAVGMKAKKSHFRTSHLILNG
jgi:hypothetical protein